MSKPLIVSLPDLNAARKRNEKVETFDYSFNPSEEMLDDLKGKRYFIRTYGCQANVRDEENMAGMLENLGMVKSESKDDCDVAIVNTCAVRENAEDKVYGELGEFKGLKAKKPLTLLLCGCMVEERPILEEVLKRYPFVDVIFGTHQIAKMPELLEKSILGKTRIIDVTSEGGNIYEKLPSKRLENFKAYVNIAYGCDKFCTYCIVPYTRGRERSRRKEDILKECKDLVDQGYQEITLLGQNVDSYGKDLHLGCDFADLLKEVSELGIPRLRFLTSYPSDFKDDVIDVIASHPNIMRYLHLPLQSGSDEVLKRMGRRYTVKEYLTLVEKIKEKIPEMAFSTDIIVGFPNETEEQFLDTVKVCKQVGYTSAFTFIYSPRKGTPAARLVDDVAYEVKSKRLTRLVEELEVGFEEKAQAMVGNTYDVLVQGPSKKDESLFTGISENMKNIHFSGDPSLIGKIVKVKVKENHLYSMIGELVDE
jgi:tRNA-2-methylthio-N6-dimethylallyladenosine synthase